MSMETAQRTYVDLRGTRVESREESLLTPEAIRVLTRLTLHNGGVSFEIEIEAEIDTGTYPFVLTGGRITEGICGAPWNITGGYLGEELRLEAARAGDGQCADTIIVVGDFAAPGAYRGTYGFNGTSNSFRHTTIYHG